MIAEIRNKISRHGHNLHDRLEDQLTGDFFGAMRYLPFDVGLLPVLKKIQWKIGGDCDDFFAVLSRISGYDYTVEFWKNYSGYGQIDVLLIQEPDVGSFACVIEVKLHSGLSPDDESEKGTSGESIKEQIDAGQNQIVRYAKLLADHFRSHAIKCLVLLAPADSGSAIVEDLKAHPLPRGVRLGLLTWQDVLSAIAKTIVGVQTEWQRRILQDLIDLLEKKGFGLFRGFGVCESTIVSHAAYVLSGNELNFDWAMPERVNEGEYYEF